jgi:arginine N-succinyltransferase
MHVIRPITDADAEDFVKIAFQAGIGMTSMPKNRDILLQRVALAVEAFHTPITKPGKEIYLFVLEDLETKNIGGICGIMAHTGRDQPMFFYRLETIEQESFHTQQTQKIPIMRAVHYYDGPSEICSLYLKPDSRHEGLGRLLSLSRFLFIAAQPQRFDQMLFAEMRGHMEKKTKICPFWEGIGRHFVDIKFETLAQIREEAIDISKALPLYPIYISLLPKETQDSIGKVHIDTIPALNMLIQEGFSLSEEIDVCDGGPKIEVEIKELRTIKSSVLTSVSEITGRPIESPKYLISNERLDFRACYGNLIVKADQGIVIHKEVAAALKLRAGEPIRYVTIAGEPIPPPTEKLS